MAQFAKTRVFMSGRSQHVTIPAEFRFLSAQVTVRRDRVTGDLILSESPDLDDVFATLDAADLPDDFLLGADRDRTVAEDRPELTGNDGVWSKQ